MVSHSDYCLFAPPELIMGHVLPLLVLEDLTPPGQHSTVQYSRVQYSTVPGQPRLQLPLEHVAHISSDKPLLVPVVERAQISTGRILNVKDNNVRDWLQSCFYSW